MRVLLAFACSILLSATAAAQRTVTFERTPSASEARSVVQQVFDLPPELQMSAFERRLAEVISGKLQEERVCDPSVNIDAASAIAHEKIDALCPADGTMLPCQIGEEQLVSLYSAALEERRRARAMNSGPNVCGSPSVPYAGAVSVYRPYYSRPFYGVPYVPRIYGPWYGYSPWVGYGYPWFGPGVGFNFWWNSSPRTTFRVAPRSIPRGPGPGSVYSGRTAVPRRRP